VKKFINSNALLGLIQGVIIALFINFESSESIDQVLLVTSCLSAWGALLFLQLAPDLINKNEGKHKNAWLMLIGYFAIFGLFGYCFLTDVKSSHQAVWGLLLFTGSYILLPFVQLSSVGETTVKSWAGIHYKSLFSHAWCNAILVKFGVLTAFIVWLVLVLWWELFTVIGIDFFEDLFTNKWFAWPVIGTVFGIGIHTAQHHFHIIDNLKRLLLSMCSLLLPLITLLTLSFVASVAFTGLNNVWETGIATPLILVLVFINILLINGASLPQDGATRLALPNNKFLRTLVYVNVVALTVLMLIAGYSSYLRIDQYGWTISRVYLALMVSVMAFYTVPYLGLLHNRETNFDWLKRSNVLATWGVLILLLLSHSPWINPVSLTINSQLSRLDQQKISAKDFDYGLFYFELGERGKQALGEYTATSSHPNITDIKQYVTQIKKIENKWDWHGIHDKSTIKSYQFEWLTDEVMTSQELRDVIKNDRYRKSCQDVTCYLIGANLDGDDELEVIYLKEGGIIEANILDQYNNQWFIGGKLDIEYTDFDDMNELIAVFKTKEFSIVPSRYKGVKIKNKVFDIHEQTIPKDFKKIITGDTQIKSVLPVIEQ
jgi:hypothetical protein